MVSGQLNFATFASTVKAVRRDGGGVRAGGELSWCFRKSTNDDYDGTRI